MIRVLIPSFMAFLSSSSFTGIETFYQKKEDFARESGPTSHRDGIPVPILMGTFSHQKIKCLPIGDRA
jgi:hypothetical protein